jgi:hypothetical protein
LFGDWVVHPSPQLLLDLPKRDPHAIAPCYPIDEELPTTVSFANEGKAEKVEGLRLPVSALSASFRREAAELDQAGFVRIERQRKLLEPLAHIVVLIVKGVDTIDTSAGLFDMNHELYASNPILVADIRRIIEKGEWPPDKRTKEFEQVSSKDGIYWRLLLPQAQTTVH